MKYLLALLFFLVASESLAFPDMVRHGYTTCVTCHFSPSGGGLLNSYGKYNAGEFFGAYNTSDDALPWLTEPLKDPKYSLGLMSRGAQTYFDTASIKRAEFVRMQFDLEGGLISGPWSAFLTTGMRGSNVKTGQKEYDLKVRSAYVNHGSIHHSVRVGRFFPEYGLKTPNHTVPTRKGLYWNEGDEPFTAQGSYYTQVFDYNIAYLAGAPETQLADKFGFSGSLIVKTANTRSGFSFLDMGNTGTRTSSKSLFTQIGYHENGYTLAEIAYKLDTKIGIKDSEKNIMFIESGWEFTHGFIPYIGYQKTYNVTSNTNAIAYPVGIRYYPITHVELVGEYATTVAEAASSTSTGAAALLMINVYF